MKQGKPRKAPKVPIPPKDKPFKYSLEYDRMKKAKSPN